MDLIAGQFSTPLTFFSLVLWVWAIAFVSVRLLGARRVTGRTTFAAGLAGYVIGVVVATAVDGDPTSTGFLVAGLVASILGTMLAVVGLELMAHRRPRAPTGPSIPRPLRALRLRVSSVRRLWAITSIAGRHGLAPLVGLRRGRSDRPDDLATALRAALEEAGGVFVKLGQLIAGRRDLVSDRVADELSGLTEDVAPAPRGHVEALLARETGATGIQFSEFEWEPFAAASIAQAHHAVLADGTPVIVKLQRPDVAEKVETDLRILRRLAETAERRTDWAPRYRLSELVDEFASRLVDELDFRLEHRSRDELATALRDTRDVRLPRIFSSSRRLIVMEEMPGTSVAKLVAEEREIPGADRLASLLVASVLQPMLDGLRFHADPHPGNVFVLQDGALGLIDFGATVRLDAIERASAIDLFQGMRLEDPTLMARAVWEIAEFHGPVDHRALERGMARILADHLGDGAALDPRAASALLQLMFQVGATLPASTAAMLRAVVTMDSTVRELAPDSHAVDSARRVADRWLRARLAPDSLGQGAAGQVARLLPILERLPRHLDQIAAAVERGELTTTPRFLAHPSDRAFVLSLLDRVVTVGIGAVFAAVGTAVIVAGDVPILTLWLGPVSLGTGGVLLLRELLAANRPR